jgi:aldehyde dehydrogenase (NAD+)
MLHKNLIAGEWVGGDPSININPSNTNDIVGEFARASADNTLAAIAVAKAAYRGSNADPIPATAASMIMLNWSKRLP